MSSDVFEVFDRRSDSVDSGPPPPRYQGAKTFFAVTLAIAVLVGMGLGTLALFRGLAQSKKEVAVCTARQALDQDAASGWLQDRAGQATGTNDVLVVDTGCTKQTAGQPIGAHFYLIGADGLAGAVATLREHDCEIKLSKAKTGKCNVTVEDVPTTVTIGPAVAADADGDYLWSIAVVKKAG